MGYCDGLITQGIEPKCDDPVVAGIEQEGIIVNRSDIDFANVEWNETSKNVIKTLPLKEGAGKAYKIVVPTNQPFNGTTTELAEGTNRNSFTNTLAFTVLDNGPEVCENIIDGLATGKFVVIYENVYKNMNKTTNKGDSAFQVVGYYQGLKATTLSNDKYSEDTEGGWSIVLTEEKAPKSALFMYNTDYKTTKEQIDSLAD